MLSSLIPEPTQRRIRHFVDEVFPPRNAWLAPRVPGDMVDGAPFRQGWASWKPVPSPITDADILGLEAVIGAPPDFALQQRAVVVKLRPSRRCGRWE